MSLDQTVWCFRVLNDLSPLISVSKLYFSLVFDRRLWRIDWFKSGYITLHKILESRSIEWYHEWRHLLICSCLKCLKSCFYTNFSFEKATKLFFALILLEFSVENDIRLYVINSRPSHGKIVTWYHLPFFCNQRSKL